MSSNIVRSWLCGHCEHTWEQGPPKPYRCPKCQSLGIMLAYGRITPKPLAPNEEPANEADVMLFVAEVKRHALTHYEEGGWDFVVEAFSDEEVAHEIRGCSTFSQALAVMQELVGLMDERRREVRSTAW